MNILPATTAEAKAILGDVRVFDIQRVAYIWGKTVPEKPLRYTAQMLRLCAAANSHACGARRGDWFLIPVLGLSLREQYTIRKADRRRPPFFENSCWLNCGTWVDYSPISEYYLVDFLGSWELSHPEMRLSWDSFVWPHEAAVTEMASTVYILSHRKINLLLDWKHSVTEYVDPHSGEQYPNPYGANAPSVAGYDVAISISKFGALRIDIERISYGPDPDSAANDKRIVVMKRFQLRS